jgi:ABC-type dipeptide/oligopeptide/nickel transport system ATPase component
MITKLTLQNFKSIGHQTYEFTNFDLLVGRNNSGKSTILQALAIWQFCVDEFRRSKRSGKKGIQIVLPNFTALPVPEFNLLWKDKTDRHWPEIEGKKIQEYILINILVEWQQTNGKTSSFGVDLRYHSSQAIYAIPSEGWQRFRECEEAGDLPVIAYVPPFSGLEPQEKGTDEAALRQKVGTGQPGSVLRNLLLRVSKLPEEEWKELEKTVKNWFSVELRKPKYDPLKDVHINVEYKQDKKDYDIIAGGSGFHQVLTLLAFLYGYKPTTILLDEPDAHLHVNLQREIIDFFKEKSQQRNIQFLIATHAEEFVRGVDASQIISLLNRRPQRIESTPAVIGAMADVSNEEITRIKLSPFIVYVEGESDERIIRAWAGECKIQDSIDKICFKAMNGGNKNQMKEDADTHFVALQKIIPEVKRLMIFDYDNSKDAFHPPADNPTLFEWKRQNIENYLLVPDAWKRASLQRIGSTEDDLFSRPIINLIDGFFVGQNLTLPPNKTWRNVDANVFQVVDGKKMLFEDNNSLFQQLRNTQPAITIPREVVVDFMKEDEIHEDVHLLMNKIQTLTTDALS